MGGRRGRGSCAQYAMQMKCPGYVRIYEYGIVQVLRLSKYRNGVSGSPHRASKFRCCGRCDVGRSSAVLTVGARRPVRSTTTT